MIELFLSAAWMVMPLWALAAVLVRYFDGLGHRQTGPVAAPIGTLAWLAYELRPLIPVVWLAALGAETWTGGLYHYPVAVLLHGWVAWVWLSTRDDGRWGRRRRRLVERVTSVGGRLAVVPAAG